MIVRFLVGAALAGIGATALAGQARPQAQPNPAPTPSAATRHADTVLQEVSGPAAIPGVALLPATQALLDGWVRDNKMPGAVGAFGFGDLPTVYVTAGRIADEAGAPAANPDSLWRVYSMTKPITGFAAMLLVEDGKLRLDQPISDFFPGFRNMRVLTDPAASLASRPATTPITVRHLLTHTAGLGYTIVIKGPLLKEYERLGIVPATVSKQVEAQIRPTRPANLQAFAERVATLPLIAEPGTKWSYSIGLDVMGAVIERASGLSFEAFLQRRLFTPLKMRSSYWTVPGSETGRFATNYFFAGANRVPLDPGATSAWLQPPSFPYGGAGLVMSARDYDAFLHMLQNGGTLDGVRVAKTATVATMMSNLLPAGVTFGGIGGGTGGTQGPSQGFGAGGSVYLADVPGGFSKGTYGWGGAAGTIGFVDPARRVRGTLMVNYMPSERWPTRAELSASLARDAARLMR